MPRFHAILITGASSGIGRALALALAAPDATLHLGGRDGARLQAVAEAVAARGAMGRPHVADVCNAAAMTDWIGGAGPLDLVIADAGISAGTGNGRPESAAQTRAIFATNLDGMLNTVLPALAVMARQEPGADGLRGRVAIIASLAAFVPAPGAPAYCAAKAAADAWTVAAAPQARRQGVLLTSICPGYIRTPMTDGNRFAMPGLMDADRAARIILRGIAADRTRIAFPWYMHFAARLAGLLPPRVLAAALARAPGKDAMD